MTAALLDERVVRRRLGPGRRIPFGFWIGPLALVGLWCLASATGFLDPRTLSEPWTVVSTAGDLIESGRLQESLVTSAVTAGLGLGIGVVAGTALAIVSGLSRAGEALVDGPVQVKRSIPSLALLPLLILWFGIGDEMKVIAIALGVAVPIYIHTHNGLRGIDSRYAELAETVDVGRSEFVRTVVLPGATSLPAPTGRTKVLKPPASLPVIGARLARGLIHQLRETDRSHHERPQLNVATQDARWFLLCNVDGVTVTTADGRGVVYRQRDREKMMELLKTSLRQHARLAREYDRMRKMYREALPELTSRQRWESVLLDGTSVHV